MKTTTIRVSANGMPQTFAGPDLTCEVKANGRLMIWNVVDNSLQAVFQDSAWEWFVMETEEKTDDTAN